MKHLTLLSTLTLTTLFLFGCSEQSKRSSSSSSSSNNNTVSDYCTTYPWASGCPGYTTSGSTTSGTTTGSTTSGSSNGNYNTITYDNNYGDIYKNISIPGDSCSTPTTKSYGPNYDTNKGTMTLGGSMPFSVANAWGTVVERLGPATTENNYATLRHSHNTSYYLTNGIEMVNFLNTDSRLRVRFKVRPQPLPKNNTQGSWCWGRASGATKTYGYTNLKFSVALQKITNGVPTGPYIRPTQLSAGLNACTGAADFSNLSNSYPKDLVNGSGLTLVVYDVQSDQGCPSVGCTTFVPVPRTMCWQMDVEVDTDETKSF